MILRHGELYGTTYYGTNYQGHVHYGTVFKLDLSSEQATIIYAFNGSEDGGFPFAGVLFHGGTLYGTASFAGKGNCGGSGCGVVYAVDPANGTETVLHGFTGADDGGNPEAELIEESGALYGTTFDGGKSGFGTVFRLTPGD